MPRVDFILWDRVYILKLICTVQMTYSSFFAILYLYLIVLGKWRSEDDERPHILEFKWTIIVTSVLDFAIGTLLGLGANARGKCCRRLIVVWIILEVVFIPLSIFLLMQLYYMLIGTQQKLKTDIHYSRAIIAQVCFICCHFPFVAYILDFLVHKPKKPKLYDPSIRPESVYEPTDPQITTTESRHIRMSHSFLFQPSTSMMVDK